MKTFSFATVLWQNVEGYGSVAAKHFYFIVLPFDHMILDSSLVA